MSTTYTPTSGTLSSFITITNTDPIVYYPKTTLSSATLGTYTSTAASGDNTQWVTFINTFFNNSFQNPLPGVYRIFAGGLPGNTKNLGSFEVLAEPVICFKTGSKILCLQDSKEIEIPIEDIKVEQLVKTINNGYIPVKKVGRSSVYNSGDKERIKDRLYKLSKDKYLELNEDLYLTGCHSILVPFLSDIQREKIIKEVDRIYVTDGHYRLLTCVDERAEPYDKEGTFDIYHLALDSEDKNRNYGIYANGLLVESCFENRIEKEMKTL
jgi:hypothetical protein